MNVILYLHKEKERFIIMAFMVRATDMLQLVMYLISTYRIRIVKKLSLHQVGIVSNRTFIAVR
jgi:hypothetical protein